MSFWTAVVVIVAIAAFAAIRIERIRARDRRPGGDILPAREAELQREIVDLKKRLAVLERIATDDRQSKAIAHEIEALRDH
jgi:hypothetical protein